MSRLQELCDKYLMGKNVEEFLRNPENRDQSSKFFGRVLEQCLVWKNELEQLESGVPQLHPVGTNAALKTWLEDDLEIAKEINKILLEVDSKEINESFNKIVKICERQLKC